MRRVVVGLIGGAVLLLGTAIPARAQNWNEMGYGLAAAGINLFWIPAKAVTAAVGLPLGGLAGVLTGGSTRAAYGVWVPTASGTWMVRPSHLDGTREVHFFGSDYADQPSRNAWASEGSYVYRSHYMK